MMFRFMRRKPTKDKIEALDGVDQVMWLDTSTSVYAADAFINFNSVDEYYKDNTAVMDIVFCKRRHG